VKLTTQSSALALLLTLWLCGSAHARDLDAALARFDEVFGATAAAFNTPTRVVQREADGEEITFHWQQGRYREELRWLGFIETFASDGTVHWYGSDLKLPYPLNGGAPPRITLELCRAFAFLQPQWRQHLDEGQLLEAVRESLDPEELLLFTPPGMQQALLALELDGSFSIVIGDAQLLAESNSFTVTTLAEFKDFGGINYASNIATVTLSGKGEVLRRVETAVQSVEHVAPLVDSQFEIESAPAVPSPPLLQVPYIVEFEQRGGMLVLPVTTADGSKLRLELDTGASTGLLRREVATQLGLTAVGDEQVVGHGGAASVSYVRLDGLKVGEAQLPPFPAAVLADSSGLDRRLGQSGIDGLVGNVLLQSYVVQIDYPRKRLTLWPRDQFDPAILGDAFTTKLHRERLPWSEVAVDGKIRGGAYFNTGAAYTFALSFWACDQAGVTYPVDSMDRAVSVGGASMFGIIRPGEVRLLGEGTGTDIILRSPLTSLELLAPGEPMERFRMASFGAGFLKDYVVTFDLMRERVYLQ
jgi:hypothetical protein